MYNVNKTYHIGREKFIKCPFKNQWSFNLKHFIQFVLSLKDQILIMVAKERKLLMKKELLLLSNKLRDNQMGPVLDLAKFPSWFILVDE